MLPLVMIKYIKLWKAAGLAHSGGRVPVRLLLPSSRSCSKGNELLPAQTGGRVPERDVLYSQSVVKEGKASAAAQANGSVPACQTPS